MSQGKAIAKDEEVMAALAHGSILLGVITSGFGGIVAALAIWLIEKEKSAYAAFQAFQALIYQVVTFVLTMLAWCCWFVVWMLMFLPPLLANPDAYQEVPPAGMWIGLLLMVVPMGFWGLTILYGLWGAVRCLGGHDFRYAIVGRWLENQR